MNCDPVELKAALQSIPWFQEINPEHFESLCGVSCLRQVEPGDELFREGDKEDFLYIVLEGRIALDIHIPGAWQNAYFYGRANGYRGVVKRHACGSPAHGQRPRSAARQVDLPGCTETASSLRQ